jgi:DNA-binding transcriptional regulator YiaG
MRRRELASRESRETHKEQAGFASELIAIRHRFDLSRSAAANLLGVPSSTVGRIEQGIMAPSAETVRALKILPTLAEGKAPSPCAIGSGIGLDGPDELKAHTLRCDTCQAYFEWILRWSLLDRIEFSRHEQTTVK